MEEYNCNCWREPLYDYLPIYNYLLQQQPVMKLHFLKVYNTVSANYSHHTLLVWKLFMTSNTHVRKCTTVSETVSISEMEYAIFYFYISHFEMEYAISSFTFPISKWNVVDVKWNHDFHPFPFHSIPFHF